MGKGTLIFNIVCEVVNIEKPSIQFTVHYEFTLDNVTLTLIIIEGMLHGITLTLVTMECMLHGVTLTQVIMQLCFYSQLHAYRVQHSSRVD